MSRIPLNSVRAFWAVSRALSFKRAAEELGVTPTAVSHQIRLLERRSGVRLFHRDAKGVSLTKEGQGFAEDLGGSIDRIDAAYRRLMQVPDRASVTLGAGPIIASRWLAPRLTQFSALYPNIDLNLLNTPTEIWRRVREFDVAIAWGSGDWPALSSELLLEVSLVPVLAPSLVEGMGPFSDPSDLASAPLLHHKSDAEWRAWFHRAGVAAVPPQGTQFGDTNVMVQAALSGNGVMLGVREFLADDIASGRLVCPFDISLTPDAAYYLVMSGSPLKPSVRTLVDWLKVSAG